MAFFAIYGMVTFTSNTFFLIKDYFFGKQVDPRTGPTPMHYTFNPESDSDSEPDAEPESEPDSDLNDPSYIPKVNKKWNLRKRRRINSI